jgi:hypothetical protein
MLSVRSGSLALQGLDIDIPDLEVLGVDRVAAAGLLPGAELTLTDCTLTVADRRPFASVFAVQASSTTSTPRGIDLEAPQAKTEARAAVIRLLNSLMRSSGDGFSLAGGRRFDLNLTNVLVATEGSLLHAFGSVRPTPVDSPAVKLRLSQVTARVEGGLVHLASTPEEPELASVDISAENSILSTADRDDPLFRLEGQDQLDELRGKIRWEGHKVAYHHIKTYRRDEILQTGVSPMIYNRTDWTNAFLPKDESPLLGDVRFLRESDASQAAWKLSKDDLRLAPSNPIAQLGPDLDRIPAPPVEGEY